MIISGVINVGGYGASHKYTSSEYDTPEECIADIRVSLALVKEPRVDGYLRRVFADATGDRTEP